MFWTKQEVLFKPIHKLEMISKMALVTRDRKIALSVNDVIIRVYHSDIAFRANVSHEVPDPIVTVPLAVENHCSASKLALPALPRPSLPRPSLPRPSLPRPSLPRPSLPRPSLPRPSSAAKPMVRLFCV